MEYRSPFHPPVRDCHHQRINPYGASPFLRNLRVCLTHMVFCSGCCRNFKPSGYTHHVQRSHASACGDAHRQALHTAELDDDPADDIEDVSPFQGDFFGDYEAGDLQWPVEAELEEGSEDGDDDDEYVDLGPHHEESPTQATSFDNHQRADDVFIEHFPSSNAGAAISDNQGFIKTDYDCYKMQCGNVDGYAPFASQIDWEIACWAKVHGLTSAAVTELLGIEGVCSRPTCYSLYLTHLCRLLKRWACRLRMPENLTISSIASYQGGHPLDVKML